MLAFENRRDDAVVDAVVNDTLALIDAHFHEPMSIATIAGCVARSPRHLSRTVREATGKTVMELLEERRMREARRLLLDTTQNVDAVSASLGYSDSAYFARRFRRIHGMPPSVWRNVRR